MNKFLTAEQIAENYDILMEKISEIFSGERKEKLLNMFEQLGDRFATAPASTKGGFHNPFPGGLLLHTLNVMNMGEKIFDVWTEFGANTALFSKESFFFVALCHDLGKVGNLQGDMYIDNDSDWHIKNRQEYYKINPEITNMKHEHRSLWLLNQFGIQLNEEEFIAILTHSGTNEPGNDFYFFPFGEGRLPRTCLIYMLSEADIMAYRIENEQFNTPSSDLNKAVKVNVKEDKKTAEDIFDELFN